MAKSYTVSIPIAGNITVTVDSATSREDALEQAYDIIDATKFVAPEHPDNDSIELEWEMFDKISNGNVLHAPLNDISIEEH